MSKKKCEYCNNTVYHNYQFDSRIVCYDGCFASLLKKENKYSKSTSEVLCIPKDDLIDLVHFVEGAVYMNNKNKKVYVKTTTNAYKIEAYDLDTDEITYINKDDDYRFIGWKV